MSANERTIYVPYMCDHALMMAAAMRYHGLRAVVLDPPDEESLAIGQKLCLGKECLPCFTCVGDMVKVSREPSFDPADATLFMPTTSGPCRFGQYRNLHRVLLDEMGLHEVAVISPNAANSYKGFGERPTQLRLLAWRGVVGVDLLQKLLHEHRPYELNAGEADALYREGLEALQAAIEEGGKDAFAVMERMAERFRALPVDRSEPRPVIGMVGEIYLRANTFTNQEIVRKVEALGGEVWVAPMMEWFYYTNYCSQIRERFDHRYLDFVKTQITDWVQGWDEHRMVKPVEDLLRNAHESPVSEVAENARPYYDPLLGTEAVLSLGKGVDFAKAGLSGILSVLPFSCMPGIIVAGLSDNVRADYDHIPWLDVIYDAQEGTNLNTRLEAFIYQARQYRERMLQKRPML